MTVYQSKKNWGRGQGSKYILIIVLFPSAQKKSSNEVSDEEDNISDLVSNPVFI